VRLYAEDWLFVGFLTLLLALVLAMGFGIVAQARADGKARAEFMAQCEEHRPAYECTAMWRDGEPETVVAPVPMFIPLR
jgi:hypothetical protein